ncbi:hypothetical protein DPMN_163056 [Dreissena polymorpha]|uniref:Uncharacterized protein n=1 Tax=Dreissena polymorpha TaxID=45954 RepID=A0A9D4EVW1_DREPO|nr:hypothetical protein DPMN_163056 [Dreissena polymorpha]
MQVLIHYIASHVDNDNNGDTELYFYAQIRKVCLPFFILTKQFKTIKCYLFSDGVRYEPLQLVDAVVHALPSLLLHQRLPDLRKEKHMASLL